MLLLLLLRPICSSGQLISLERRNPSHSADLLALVNQRSRKDIQSCALIKPTTANLKAPKCIGFFFTFSLFLAPLHNDFHSPNFFLFSHCPSFLEALLLLFHLSSFLLLTRFFSPLLASIPSSFSS